LAGGRGGKAHILEGKRSRAVMPNELRVPVTASSRRLGGGEKKRLQTCAWTATSNQKSLNLKVGRAAELGEKKGAASKGNDVSPDEKGG